MSVHCTDTLSTICTYVHSTRSGLSACTPASIYEHTYIHTTIHTYIYTYIQPTCIHTYLICHKVRFEFLSIWGPNISWQLQYRGPVLARGPLFHDLLDEVRQSSNGRSPG